MVFFHWHEPYGYLNAANDTSDPFGTRSTQFHSQSEKASAALYSLTYWGDYGGSDYSRFHYDTVIENAPNLVRSIAGNYGDGLVLRIGEIGEGITDNRFIREREFLAAFFRWAFGRDGYGRNQRDDYPLFEDYGDFSDWEWEKKEEIFREDRESWMDSDIRISIGRLTNYEVDSDDITDEEITAALNHFREDRYEQGYPYFESATTLAYGSSGEDVAAFILDRRNEQKNSAE